MFDFLPNKTVHFLQLKSCGLNRINNYCKKNKSDTSVLNIVVHSVALSTNGFYSGLYVICWVFVM
jgi:hypothetical protein